MALPTYFSSISTTRARWSSPSPQGETENWRPAHRGYIRKEKTPHWSRCAWQTTADTSLCLPLRGRMTRVFLAVAVVLVLMVEGLQGCKYYKENRHGQYVCAEPRPGVCPIRRKRCVRSTGNHQLCDFDSECPGNWLCCYDDCGLRTNICKPPHL
ncbi:uncharacterized protein LOC143019028 [Oratosquilla oratoria]|uniref:uncharacterized protein LOC143019028 n=1 Tax=Oratosquilla oratoria TaxID=337810 RepID=UPI003F772479